jgi:hypothetical protein
MSFVPPEHRHDTLPCHHIPLNENGQTIHSLYGAGTNKEIEMALRTWLLKTIKKLQ